MKDQHLFDSPEEMNALSRQISALLNQATLEDAPEQTIRAALEDGLENAKKEGFISEGTISKLAFEDDPATSERITIEVI